MPTGCRPARPGELIRAHSHAPGHAGPATGSSSSVTDAVDDREGADLVLLGRVDTSSQCANSVVRDHSMSVRDGYASVAVCEW